MKGLAGAANFRGFAAMLEASDIRLTEEQYSALELDRDVAVIAGAGTGKTRVMVERYLKILLEGRARVENIVAITFTERAAAQLKERIRARLLEILNREGRTDHLTPEVLEELEGAYVGTIHGFCSQILRERSLELGIDPDFRVLDATAAEVLMEETASQWVRRGFRGEGPPELLDSLYLLAERFRMSARAIVRALVQIGLRRNALALWRARAERDPVAAALENPAVREVLKDTPPWEKYLRGVPPAAFVEETLLVPYGEALRPLDRDMLRRACDSGDLADLAAALLQFRAPGRIRREVDRARKQCQEYLGLYTRLGGLDVGREVEGLRAFLRVFDGFLGAYEVAKSAGRFLDFEDLLWKVWELLESHPQVREEYQARFRYILVDEFQDTDPLQWRILHVLGERGNLFVVGDPKQSIYRFRGADVAAFMRAVRDLKERGAQEVALTVSHRLHAQTAAFVNAGFPRILTGGALDYQTAYQPVRAGNPRTPQGPAVHLVPVQGRNARDHREEEARRYAQIIRALHREGYRYGDIALLFRSGSDIATYQEVLRREGIPSYTISGRGFYARQEIADLVNFLRVLRDPEDRLALYGVLRSPFVGVSDETIYYLHRELEVPEYRRDEKEAVEAFLEEVAELRRLLGMLPYHRLLERIFERTPFLVAGAAGEDGILRTANLRKLVSLVQSLEETFGGVSLDFLIDHLESMRLRGAPEAEAQLEEGLDAVLLITIHSAKGLEFPVVFLADLFRRGPSPGGDTVAFDEDLGLAPPGGVLEEVARELSKRKEQEEEKRLLYVAITRTRERLYLPFWMNYKQAGPIGRAFLDLLGEEVVQEIRKGPQVRQIPFGESQLAVLWELPKEPEEEPEEEVAPVELPLPPQERVRPVPRPPRRDFPVTALIDYAECPYRYRLKYEEGIPAFPLQMPAEGAEHVGLMQVELGNLLHRMFQFWDLEGWPGELIRELVRGFPGDARRVLERTARVVLSGTVSLKTRVRRARGVLREMPFSVRYEGRLFRGKVDLLLQEGERYEVVDYKLGRIERRRAPHLLQLRLYGLFLSRLFQHPPDRGVLYFFPQGKELEVPFPPKALEEAEQELKRILNQIDKGRFERPHDPRAAEICRRCPYLGRCLAEVGPPATEPAV